MLSRDKAVLYQNKYTELSSTNKGFKLNNLFVLKLFGQEIQEHKTHEARASIESFYFSPLEINKNIKIRLMCNFWLHKT